MDCNPYRILYLQRQYRFLHFIQLCNLRAERKLERDL